MKTVNEIVSAISRASVDEVLRYLFTAFIAIMLIVVMLRAVIVMISLQPTSDVFSTRFDECMATEKFTRDECIVYAKGE